MNEIADTFVKLALAVGHYDADYVDAYYGPQEWRLEVETESLSLQQISDQAKSLLEHLEALMPTPDDKLGQSRKAHLDKTLRSLIARVDQLMGSRLSFDEESLALYDALAPRLPREHFEEILGRIDAVLPGQGSISERYEVFKLDFLIPVDRLDTVFTAAIAGCRERTLRFLALPAGESFEVEYVTGKSWSGYNWYKGGFHSLIQFNTDIPATIDRALDLACHEGYPGHHVYNALIERDFVRHHGWREFTIYPLFSPQSLIAEGTANFGIEVIFDRDERLQFEKDVLFPLAGLDPDSATEYYRILGLVEELDYAGNEAARRYIEGEIDAEAAVEWLTDYSLMSPAKAEQRLRFIEQYRSYVINYNLGEDLVRGWVERHGGTAEDRERRGQLFADLLTNPYLPSDLRQAPSSDIVKEIG